MINHRLLFTGVVLAALTIILAACGRPGGETPPAAPAIPPGAVTIKALPPLLTLRGDEVPFRGKTEIVQRLAGPAATEVVVVAFSASGENAHKSAIKIEWEDGGVETFPPGSKNITLSPQRRAKKISVLGYSFHERRVFKDVAKTGTLSWEIRYAPSE
ncbi:hypothetical protein [Anaeroselena agilis]|uniref:Lipoprotein n=1 Tax=Anaeroselena agilis TaxID=3063788 RepID=A0ABU3P1F0_9FIRM|nr:hypothetical protein [Selenomonadales bacterium 4137-cl]